MDENLQNIEDLFKDRLEGNEEMPPPHVWKGIDNDLNKDDITSIKKKYTAMKRLAALLLLLLLCFGIYDLATRQTTGGIAKENNNDSETTVVSNDNKTETAPTNTGKPKTQADTADGNKNYKINKDNKAAPENTVNNNQQTGTENNSSDIVTPDKKLKLNTPVNNSVAANNLPAVNTKSNSLNKQKIKTKPGSDNSSTANNTTVSKLKRKLNDKASYKVNIINPGLSEDEPQPIVKNDAAKNKQKTKPEDLVSVDKIQNEGNDFVNTKNISQLQETGKPVSSLDTKNAMAINAKNKNRKPSRFSITPFFSPDIAWYRLQNDKPDNQRDNLSEIEKSEKHEFSSTLGAMVDYRLNNHWSLQSGLTYSNTNITIEPKTLYAQADNNGNVKYKINTSSGYGYVLPSFSTNPAIGDSLYAFTSKHTLNYISVPLAVKYNVTKKKFSFNAMLGVAANFLTKGRIETKVESGVQNEAETVNKLLGLKKSYFTGLAGLGVDYKLNNKMAVSFVPTFRFALNSINQDASVKSYPNSFGLTVGLKYTF